MSYCGACGCFFYPDCPRRPEGTCSPAPNPHELVLAQALATVAEANAKVAGMVADNEFRATQMPGRGPRHRTEDFAVVTKAMRMCLQRLGIEI